MPPFQSRFLIRCLTLVTSLVSLCTLTSSLFGQSGLPTLEEALEMSKRTGAPILAMAGRETWPPCVSLLKRLSNDRSLAAFGGRFVPLKITTSGSSSEWKQWASKYKYEGRGIPILYVVRSDGKQLYGRSGSLPGNALKVMLTEATGVSGRVLMPEESELVIECCRTAKSALESDELFRAARAMQPVAKIGPLGQLQSFAAAAIEADQLAGDLSAQALESLETQQASMSGSDAESSFAAVAQVFRIRRAFDAFPSVKSASQELIKQIKSDDATRPLWRPAEAITKARELAGSAKDRDRERAETAYAKVVRSFPESIAVEIATAELKELNPDSDALAKLSGADSDADAGGDTTVEPASGADATNLTESYREWSDASGKYRVVARLVKVEDQVVTLEMKDGKRKEVELAQLGIADQKLLNGFVEND